MKKRTIFLLLVLVFITSFWLGTLSQKEHLILHPETLKEQSYLEIVPEYLLQERTRLLLELQNYQKFVWFLQDEEIIKKYETIHFNLGLSYEVSKTIYMSQLFEAQHFIDRLKIKQITTKIKDISSE